MISFATDQGSVGAHFDSYDVFLLQAHGQRRWRIGPQKDLHLIDGLPLKILRQFEPEQEYVLEPGDMLYLPPHYAHEGIAIGECMTYSVGFRAPSYQELGEAFLQFMSDSIALPGRYGDADLKPTKHPAEISRDMLTQIAADEPPHWLGSLAGVAFVGLAIHAFHVDHKIVVIDLSVFLILGVVNLQR